MAGELVRSAMVAAWAAGYRAGRRDSKGDTEQARDLVAVCRAFVAAYSENGEFNTHTAEHSPSGLRKMAKAAIAAAKGGVS